MKTEPSTFSFSDLEKAKTTFWEGVRNYQARNFMRDKMQIKDTILVYHSNAQPSGIVGLAEVVELAKPDASSYNPHSEYYDPKSTKENPRWCAVTIGKPQKFSHFVTLAEMREDPFLTEMLLLRKGQRLSILPVLKKEYERILVLADNLKK